MCRILSYSRIFYNNKLYSQVHRVEEQHNIFALEVTERDVLELAVHNGGGLELGRGLCQLERHLVEAGIQI